MDLETLLRGAASRNDEEKEMNKTEAKAQISALQELHRSLNINEPFRAGDIVTWKDGLKDKKIPLNGQYGIIDEVLSEPVMEPDAASCGSQVFRQKYDVKIGVLHGGDYIVYHYDSRRFKKVK